MSKVDFQSAVQKLDDMISKRYDARVQFISGQSVRPSEVVLFETVRRNSSAPLIVTHNNMLIPLRVEGSLMGAILVSDISNLSGIELSRVKETIDLILAEKFISRCFEDSSDIIEMDSVVIPFRKNNDEYATAN